MYILYLLAIPLLIYIGIIYLNNRKYIYISLVIIILSCIPFFIRIWKQTIKVAEFILISVLSAISVIGRIAFYWLPQFKPTTAIVIISAITLGPEAGFLIGGLSGFLSNFYFGQGPWTPFQMFAWGIIGYISGLIFQKIQMGKIALSIYGFIATFLIYGGILNFVSVVMYTTEMTPRLILSFYMIGIPFDLIHATSTLVFLYFIANPFIEKIQRIQVKYGLLSNRKK